MDTCRLRNSPRVTQQHGARVLTLGGKFQSLLSSLPQPEFPSPAFPSPSGRHAALLSPSSLVTVRWSRPGTLSSIRSVFSPFVVLVPVFSGPYFRQYQ